MDGLLGSSFSGDESWSSVEIGLNGGMDFTLPPFFCNVDLKKINRKFEFTNSIRAASCGGGSIRNISRCPADCRLLRRGVLGLARRSHGIAVCILLYCTAYTRRTSFY